MSKSIIIESISLRQIGEPTPEENVYISEQEQKAVDIDDRCLTRLAAKYPDLDEEDILTFMMGYKRGVSNESAPSDFFDRYNAVFKIIRKTLVADLDGQPSQVEYMLTQRIEWDKFSFNDFAKKYKIEIDANNPAWTRQCSIAVGEKVLEKLIKFVDGELSYLAVGQSEFDAPKNSPDVGQSSSESQGQPESTGSISTPASTLASPIPASTGTGFGKVLVAA